MLSLALASLAGFRPFWHQLIEHGGQGPWHTHNGYSEPKPLLLVEADTVLLVKAHPTVQPAGEATSKLKPHGDFKLPLKPLSQAVHRLAKWFGTDDTATKKNTPQHEHHSLAQLLAGGLVEQAIDIPLVLPFTAPFSIRFFGNEALLLESPWDLQSAGRAPPASWS